jgi:hypothetical protein
LERDSLSSESYLEKNRPRIAGGFSFCFIYNIRIKKAKALEILGKKCYNDIRESIFPLKHENKNFI